MTIRSEPDSQFSSSQPASVGPDFVAANRQVGWLIVNNWTYRPLRWVGGRVLPKVDSSGVTIIEDSSLGSGVQVVTPTKRSGAGAVMLIHGGGFVIGSNKDPLILAVELANACGVPVVCPSYRLAPEHPFPAALDDCDEAWRWLQGKAEELDVDPAKLVVGGVSAGGGHAAALAQRLLDGGGQQPAGQLLVYPMLDDRTAARTELDGLKHRVWSNRNNRFGWRSYLGYEPGQPCAPYASPARRADVSNLPPTWVGVGSADLFLDEDREYVQRLRSAGVDAMYVEVPGGIHGFDVAQDSALTTAFYDSAADFVRIHTA